MWKFGIESSIARHQASVVGVGRVVEPEEGDVLGVTSRERPFLTLEIDLGVSDTAKTTYPRYVLD